MIKYLKKPITINKLQLKNRLVMPPMATSKAYDGVVTKEMIDYYNDKSAGGYIGLIITEHSYINIQGMAHPGQMSVSRDSDVEGLKRLVDVIHGNGSKVIAQISHAGSASNKDFTGCNPISASAIPNVGTKRKEMILPEEMIHEKITEVIGDFAKAAKRVKEAGFDGVEIHSAHGYLLNQFYSPLTNKREDEYSGYTMKGRLRFQKEVIESVRREVGEDFLIALRLGGCDYMEGGSTIEDSVEAAKLLEGYGMDLLDITGGMNGFIIPGNQEHGYFSPMSKAIKTQINIPVILTGGITDAEEADKLISTGKADLIGVGRAILKDSLWAKKAMMNEE